MKPIKQFKKQFSLTSLKIDKHKIFSCFLKDDNNCMSKDENTELRQTSVKSTKGNGLGKYNQDYVGCF